MTGQRIVIVGGGFAGVTLAQELESLCDTSTEIVVVSRDNHLVLHRCCPKSRAALSHPSMLRFPDE